MRTFSGATDTAAVAGRPARLAEDGDALGAVGSLTYRVGAKKSPGNRGLFWKRLKGLEPSTFCMASRRSSQLSYSREGAEYNRPLGPGPVRVGAGPGRV